MEPAQQMNVNHYQNELRGTWNTDKQDNGLYDTGQLRQCKTCLGIFDASQLAEHFKTKCEVKKSKGFSR